MIKSLAANTGDKGLVLGGEDPLDEEMATHFVFLPRESRGQRSLAGYSPWGCRESHMTEQLSTHVKSDALC